ncbi:ubiquinone biosynthesis protein [Actinobacillus equuli]|nr:ubiquinone biosynthesis protein [Actinobacillus equuli]
MTFNNTRRLYQIITTFLRYGIDEIIPDIPLTRHARLGRKALFWVRNQHKDQPFGVRLRLALQELGRCGLSSGKCFLPAVIYLSRN